MSNAQNSCGSILVVPALSEQGYVRVQVWNSSSVTKWITQKTCIVDVLILGGVRFSYEAETIAMSSQTRGDVDQWVLKYPRLFAEDTAIYARSPELRSLEVCHREIHWRIPFSQIPLSSIALKYQPDEVSEDDASEYLSVLKKRGIIRRLDPHEKCHYSPCMFLRKKNGSIRKVVDFRRLNAYSFTWSSPLPDGVMGVLRRIRSDWRVYTVLDLTSGFSNIPVCSQLQTLFGFEHGQDRYTYRTLPQGWANSSSLFHTRMTQALRELPVVIYIDDLITGGSTKKEHDQNLNLVLKKLSEMEVYLNAEKTQHARESVVYLGYDVSQGRVSLKSYIEKQKKALPVATTTKQLQKILGIFNYCRGVVPRLDSIVAPIRKELRKKPDQRVCLTELQALCEEAWALLSKKSLELALQRSGEWLLSCDWSTSGQGYCLWHSSREGCHLVAINSKACSDPVSSHLGELRAIQWSLEEVKHLTAGHKVVLCTDSSSAAVRLLQESSKADVSDVRCARLLGWIWSNYPFNGRLEVRHVSGEHNYLADPFPVGIRPRRW